MVVPFSATLFAAVVPTVALGYSVAQRDGSKPAHAD
jgi:hypothetical protein